MCLKTRLEPELINTHILQRIWHLRVVFIILLVVIHICSFAQKREYSTARVSGEKPRIDGVASDEAWQQVEWSGDFVQREPFEKAAPSQATQFKLLYDDNNLYVLVKAFDSAPDSIAKRMSRRDSFDGDWVEVSIDSYHDLLSAFSFTVNAAGVKSDEKVTNDGEFDSSWDPIWYVKTSIDKDGWLAEMRIPFTQLRFGKQEEYVWGFQVNRLLFRKSEYSSWQFISPQASGWVSKFGELYGVRDIKPQKQMNLTPYVVGKMENYQGDEENPFATGREYNASVGVDGKFGITNDITLDFTINPDFGQVEADPSEVNLSTFETFFPERRSFFIEGKDILSHGITPGGPMRRDNLFYSRRIGRNPGYWPELNDDYDEYVRMPQNTSILGAFKISGKTKKGLSIGILESMTQLEHAEIARNIPNGSERHYEYRTEPVEPFTNYFAARVEQDLNNSNTQVGGMVTAVNRDLYTQAFRDNMPSAAYSAGVNFNHNWKDKTYYVNLNLVGSKVQGSDSLIHYMQTSSPHYFQRPDASHVSVDTTRTSLNGSGGTFQIGKSGNGKWRFTNWITYRSPQANLNDMGYMRRNDEVQQIYWMQYRENDPKGFYRSYSINFNQWFATTLGPEYRYFGFNVNGRLVFKNQWSVGGGSSRELKSLSPDELRGGPALLNNGQTDFWTSIGTDHRKKLVFELGYNGGVSDGRSTKYSSISFEVDVQFSDAFKLSVEPELFRWNNRLEYVSNADYGEIIRYVRGDIKRIETSLEIRFSYNITPDFTIEYYGMPFISAAEYNNFKYISESRADKFEDRFIEYTNEQISYNSDDAVYVVDEGNNGTVSYEFDNPNFNVMDFNSNLVVRWEYLPGSTVYLVWNQQRSNDRQEGNYSFGPDFSSLFINTYPRDVFLVKFSYRFGR